MTFPKLFALKQIRKSCLECSGNQTKQVLFCQIIDCPLWYLRFGTYPRTKIKQDKRYEKLLNPTNFIKDGIYGPEYDVEELSM